MTGRLWEKHSATQMIHDQEFSLTQGVPVLRISTVSHQHFERHWYVLAHQVAIPNNLMDVDIRKGFSFHHCISSDIDLEGRLQTQT